MRKWLCLLPLWLLACTAQAQNNTLAAFNQHQDQIMRTGMFVLGGWAVANILVGSFKLTSTTRAKRYFYQMNLYWNIVNLLIAGIALHGIVTAAGEPALLAESMRQHVWYKKILYLNTGLDLGYVMLGAYLTQKAKTSLMRPEKLQGWGQAIILQGIFLFVLDVVLVILLEQKADILFNLLP